MDHYCCLPAGQISVYLCQCTSIAATRANVGSPSAFLAHPKLGLNLCFLKQTSNHALKKQFSHQHCGVLSAEQLLQPQPLSIPDRGNVTIQGLPRMTAE